MNCSIAIHDAESEHLKRKTFPNFALMKLSAYHKQLGDTVSWWQPDQQYDLVYSSKVFDFTQANPKLPANAIRGGSGYSDIPIDRMLPVAIDNQFPDYSVYPQCDYAIGFLTRGCPNHCRWCIVPTKEGAIYPYREWQELVRTDTNKLILMDNNILACEHGIEQLEKLTETNYQIDINQGMDARLIDQATSHLLARLKWIRFLRFSCDQQSQIQPVRKAANLLLSCGVRPYRMFIYLLVTSDIQDAVLRVEALKDLRGINLYAQPERNTRLGIIPNRQQKEFAHRYMYSGRYRKETWDEYCQRHNLTWDK